MTASAVESQIVGYRTEKLVPNNDNMISISFNKVDGGNVYLADLDIKNHSETGDFSEQGTDFIYIWKANDSGYDQFYYYADESKWCLAYSADEPFEEIYEDGLPAGAAMWYQASGDCVREGDLVVTSSGAVESDADDITLITWNDNMVANPYPVATNFNDPESVIITNHSETGDFSEPGTDFIFIWKAQDSGYDQFYYYADESKWCLAYSADEPFEEIYEGGIPAGTPFWYQGSSECVREGDLKITFINPIK